MELSPKGRMDMSDMRKPFHDSIVDAINRAGPSFEFEILARLIHRTKIPKGHDEIMEAWIRRTKEVGLSHDLDVPGSLLEQKAESEEKTVKAGTSS